MREDLVIRSAVPGDADALLEIYGPIVRDTWVSFETAPPSVDDFRSRIETALAEWAWLVAVLPSGIAGYAFAGMLRTRAAYRWSVETSINVAPHSRRSGVGTTLYTQLARQLIDRGFCNAYAAIALPNDPSIALHRRVGFTPIGVFERVGWKFGAWRDVSWWQRRLRETPPDLSP